MLNLVQHLTNSRTYETLKQVQGDKSGLFTGPSNLISWFVIFATTIKDYPLLSSEILNLYEYKRIKYTLSPSRTEGSGWAMSFYLVRLY
jgi:hypothetical protein